jgi:mono/diheme cytochrome c family protein
MRRRVGAFMLSLAVLGLLLSACGAGAAPAASGGNQPGGAAASAGNAAAGQTKYAGSCAACHGADATGVAGLGKDLVTSDFTHGLSDAELVNFIKVGRSVSDPANTTGIDMPPKGGNPALTDADLADIVAYLRTIQQ